MYCPVRSLPGDGLDTATLWLSMLLPTLLGPLLSLLLLLLTLPCSWGWRHPPSCSSCLLLPLLSLLHLATYYTHLLLSERLELEEFHYLLVKYGLGQGFVLLTPALVLVCSPQLRKGVRTTFRSAVLCPDSPVQKHSCESDL